MRLKSDRLHALLLFVVLAFAVLDGLRDTFLSGNPVSYLKEFVPVVGLALSFYQGGVFRGLSMPVFVWVWVVAYAGLLVMSAVNNFGYGDAFSNTISNLGQGGWSVFVKCLALGFLAFYLVVLKFRYPALFQRIPSIYVGLCHGYCALTILFLTTGWARMLPKRNWHGRLSIGYPTMDSAILVAGMALSLGFRSRALVVFSHAVFGLVLLMQNTASGYLLAVTYLCGMALWLPGRWKALPLIALLGGGGVVLLVYRYLAEKMGTFGLLFIDKVNGFIFGGETSSMELRQIQMGRLINEVLSDPVSLLLGGGGMAGFYVENLYLAVLGLGGILALTFHASLYFDIALRALRSQERRRILLVLAIYLVGGLSLTAYYLYPFLFLGAYAFALSMRDFQAVRRVPLSADTPK